MNRTDPEIGGISRASLAVAAFSTVVEWYDFTLFLYFATVLARVFFGGGETSLAATFGAFAVAYLARPLGALVFGRIGDRRGRRSTMLLSMGVMAIAMLATALLPTRSEIGPAAAAMLLALRCVMGFAVGGEYTGVVAYLLEGAPAHRRGLVTSLAAASSEVGALLAAGVAALTVSALDPAVLDAWGWRVPFFVGAALASAVLVARATLEESPEFERQVRSGTVPAHPVGRMLGAHRGGVARGFAISALGSITYYVGITYVPAFLTSVGVRAERESLQLSVVAALAVIVVTPFAGLLSDRIGRRPVLVALCLGSAFLPIGLFAMMAHGTPIAGLLGAVALACLAGGISAVGAVATAEQLPGEGRLSGLALGATTATAVFGGLTPFLSEVLIRATGWSLVPGAMIAVVALAVLPVLMRLPAAYDAR